MVWTLFSPIKTKIRLSNVLGAETYQFPWQLHLKRNWDTSTNSKVILSCLEKINDQSSRFQMSAPQVICKTDGCMSKKECKEKLNSLFNSYNYTYFILHQLQWFFLYELLFNFQNQNTACFTWNQVVPPSGGHNLYSTDNTTNHLNQKSLLQTESVSLSIMKETESSISKCY